ncbi:keratin, type II cytoskeletal 2 epidermal [Musca domestica]|uniref:Keratin, type II cytoskeletal 2 epidermal n=1 Tax=Musca domestica TaxID=7370 RepID=A0A9J7CLS9_MUSDO|nr:keratin, type II cytoskeletal 2 epidermal [Musca domestica]
MKGLRNFAPLLLLLQIHTSWSTPILDGGGASSSSAVATATAGGGGVATATASASSASSGFGPSAYGTYYPTLVQQVPVPIVQTYPVVAAPIGVGGAFGGAGFGGGFKRYHETYTLRGRGFGGFGGFGHGLGGGFGGGRYKVHYSSGGVGAFGGAGLIGGGGAILG